MTQRILPPGVKVNDPRTREQTEAAHKAWERSIKRDEITEAVIDAFLLLLITLVVCVVVGFVFLALLANPVPVILGMFLAALFIRIMT